MSKSESVIGDYTIIHVGNGKFEARELSSNKIYKVGSGISGIIRYTYFEDYTLPEIGWKISHNQMLKDYHPKALNDMKNGKFETINMG